MVGNTGRHTHAHTHTHTQADTTYNCACLLCVCVDFFPCVVTLTTRRMRNVWQIQCEPTMLLLPHTLHSYHLCTNVANSAYKCNKVAGLPFYLSAPRSFSLVLFGKEGKRERGHKALPVSELSLTAHSGMHTHTQAHTTHACTCGKCNGIRRTKKKIKSAENGEKARLKHS